MKNNKLRKSAKQPGGVKNKFRIYLGVLIIVPFALYFRVINFGFSNIDDVTIITSNFDVVSNLSNIPKAFTTDAFFSHTTNFYRPIQMVSFMISAQISGQNPWAYHLINLLLHILVVVVLFIFLKKIGFKEEISFLLALLFAIHPMMTNAACWVPAQGDLFLTLFGLLSFVTFIKYYESRKTIYLAFHFVVFLLLCFSKETAVVFPFLLLAYFFLILKKEKSWKDILPFAYIWGGSFTIYLILRHAAVAANTLTANKIFTAFIKDLPAIPITFGKYFLPHDLNTMPIFSGLSVVVGIIVFLILLILVFKYKVNKNPYLIFGAVWFLTATLPPLFTRMQNAEVGIEYFEYRAELPLIGIIIITGVFLNLLSGSAYKKILRIFISVLMVLTIMSYIHTKDYSDTMSFAESGLNSNPNNVYALNLRGVAYGKVNKELAMQDFDKAIKICPVYSGPWYNKGVLYHAEGEELKAENCYSTALAYDTTSPDRTLLPINILYNFAYEEIVLKKYDKAITLLKMAVAEYKTNSDIYNNLGFAYLQTGRYDSAVYSFTRAIEIQPISPFSFKNRGQAKYALKDFRGALADYSRVLELDPGTAESWFNTGRTKIEVGDYAGAVSDLSNAIGMNPSWGEAYYKRGLAFSKMNKPAEAERDLAEARKLGYISGKK